MVYGYGQFGIFPARTLEEEPHFVEEICFMSSLDYKVAITDGMWKY